METNEIRRFKDISKHELKVIVKETFYYYLLSDIIESKNDREAFNQAIDIAIDSWARAEEIQKEILAIISKNVEADESYSDFEDSLFQATEHAIY